MGWQIPQNFLPLPMEIFCLGRGYGSSQKDWEMIFEEKFPTVPPQIFGGIHKLCAVHRSCRFQDWTVIELFLACDHHWRGRPPAVASAWSFVG